MEVSNRPSPLVDEYSKSHGAQSQEEHQVVDELIHYSDKYDSLEDFIRQVDLQQMSNELKGELELILSFTQKQVYGKELDENEEQSIEAVVDSFLNERHTKSDEDCKLLYGKVRQLYHQIAKNVLADATSDTQYSKATIIKKLLHDEKGDMSPKSVETRLKWICFLLDMKQSDSCVKAERLLTEKVGKQVSDYFKEQGDFEAAQYDEEAIKTHVFRSLCLPDTQTCSELDITIPAQNPAPSVIDKYCEHVLDSFTQGAFD